ncbi:MAG: DUF4199 domain-containing protein [Bacteroidota bacterium]
MKNLTLPIRFGIVTSGILIAYFLILALLGKHTNVFFSLFNGVITGFGIYETIKYTKIKLGKDFNYGKGFTAGITMGFVATLLFSIFFAFYSTELNSNFLNELSEVWSKDYANFEGIVFFTVAIMGFATTLVLTLSFMQLFKTSNNPKKSRQL